MQRRTAIQSISAVLGYSLTPTMITGLISSCKEERKEGVGNPLFFELGDMPILGKLGEAFLPRTETPGAMDVKAHLFVDVFLAKLANVNDQKLFKRGFKAWKNDFEQVTKTAIEGAD